MTAKRTDNPRPKLFHLSEAARTQLAALRDMFRKALPRISETEVVEKAIATLARRNKIK